MKNFERLVGYMAAEFYPAIFIHQNFIIMQHIWNQIAQIITFIPDLTFVSFLYLIL